MILGIIASAGGDIPALPDGGVFPSMLEQFSGIVAVLAGAEAFFMIDDGWEDISFIFTSIGELPLTDLPESTWHQVNHI